jgi:hypothetical protein
VRFHLAGRDGEAGASFLVDIASDAQGGFDLDERYRNPPDPHVLRSSDGST